MVSINAAFHVIHRISCPEVLRKKVLFEISQNSQENTCAESPF